MKQADTLYTLVTQSPQGSQFGQAYGWDLGLDVCTWRGVTCDDGVSVTKLDLTGAGYEGTIPMEFENLVVLKELVLANNRFAGLVPVKVAQLPALEVFNVGNNTLMGPLPSFDKNKSPGLQKIILQHNKFTHHLSPEWVSNLPSSLTELDLSENELYGSLPPEIIQLTELNTLDLSVNEFYGTIPEQLANLYKLRYLYLNVNHFVGTIPRTMASADKLYEEVWLQNNWLSGTIPPDFAEMPNLLDFYVDGNYFTGTIPPDLCRANINSDFFKDQYNTEIYSSETGSPRDYCQSISCPTDHYSIEGIWPCQPCPSTERSPYLGTETKCFPTTDYEILKQFWMDTHGNEWSGSSTWFYDGVEPCEFTGVTCDIKGAVIKIVLPYMNLRGTISPELGFLEHLDTLILSDNKLSGYLPATLQVAPLEILDVTGNRIQGIIPPKMCLMSVNRNGENSIYECENVACPAGTYHPTGVGPGCQPCTDGPDYIGQKQCESASIKKQGGFVSSVETAATSKGGKIAGGIFLFLLIATFAYCIVFCMCKRYRDKKAVLVERVIEGRRKKQAARRGEHAALSTDDAYEESYMDKSASTPRLDDRFEIANPELCDVPVLETPKVDTPDFPDIPEMT